jgi:hypothetical protein
LLVPATMKLLGERNWWAPAPLRRFHDRYGCTRHRPPRPVPPVTRLRRPRCPPRLFWQSNVGHRPTFDCQFGRQSRRGKGSVVDSSGAGKAHAVGR